MPDVRYVISVDAEGAVSKIETVDQALEKLKGTTDDATKKDNYFSDALSGVWKQFTVGAIAASAVQTAIGDVKDLFSSSIEAAKMEEQTEVKLTAALQLNGQARLAMLPGLKEFARDQQNATIFSRYQIEASEAVLASLTHLDQDGIQVAIKGAIGLASVFGLDLEQATRMVEKAATGHAEALARYGIVADSSLSKTEQFADILRQLTALYPLATAQTSTLEGGQKQLANTTTELKARFGAIISDTLGLRDAQAAANTIAKDLLNTFKEMPAPITAAGVQMKVGFGPVSAFVPDAVYADVAAKNLTTSIKGLGDFAEQSGLPMRQMGDDTLYAANAWQTFISWTGKSPALEKFVALLTELGLHSTEQVASGLKDITSKEKDLSLAYATGVISLTQYNIGMENLWAQKDKLIGVDTFLQQQEKGLQELSSGWFEEIMKGTNIVDDFASMWEENDRYIDKSLQDMETEQKNSIKLTGEQRAAAEGYAGAARKAFQDPFSGLKVGDLAGQLARVQKEMASIGPATPVEKVKTLDKEIQQLQEDMNKASAATIAKLENWGIAVQGVGNIFSQLQTNQTQAIDNDYQQRLDAINKNIKDETKRQAAIDALNTEFDAKRHAAARAAAIEAKAIALAQATINMFEAITKTYAELGPFGIPMGTLMGILCAAEIAAIAAQPIPLAQGAVFTKATPMLMGGREYVGGEAGPEILGSEATIRRVVREEVKAAGRSGTPVIVTFNVQAFDSQDVATFLRSRAREVLQGMLDRRELMIRPA